MIRTRFWWTATKVLDKLSDFFADLADSCARRVSAGYIITTLHEDG